MKYQTGDYITFHTKEQWGQIVEKLERDGQKVYNKVWNSAYNSIALVSNSSHRWGRRTRIVVGLYKNDITDEFFEAVLQDELCSNPPLEVGDSFVGVNQEGFNVKGWVSDEKWEISTGTYKTVVYNNGFGKCMHPEFLNKIERGDFKILSYKQANPVQESWKVPVYSKRLPTWMSSNGGCIYGEGSYDFLEKAYKQLFEHKKRYISLTGDAVPDLYKIPMKPHGREIVMLMTNRYGYCALESCWEDKQWLVVDSFNKKVFGSDISQAIEVVPESIYHTPPAGHSHLATLADQPDEYLFAEALNEEEYQKWISYVNNYHKMMLENEKAYRAECFKIIEEVK